MWKPIDPNCFMDDSIWEMFNVSGPAFGTEYWTHWFTHVPIEHGARDLYLHGTEKFWALAGEIHRYHDGHEIFGNAYFLPQSHQHV